VKLERLWPLGVVAVLALTVLANVAVFWAARDRNAAVVEPDYYRRAVGYDSTLAAEHRSAALGWRVEAELGEPGAGGAATLRVRLLGRDGAPLDSARVTVGAVHNRDAARVVRAALAPEGGGRYAAMLPLRLAGRWELDLEAARGTDRYRVRVHCDTGSRSAG
jgi:nitrogen fixation protein FixH